MYLLKISSIFRERKDLDMSKCIRHEKSVGDVMATICSMTSPFNGDQAELIGILSSVEVEGSVSDNILQAEQFGEHQFSAFVNNNLLSDKPDLFVKIKQNKLKTFTSKHLTVKNRKAVNQLSKQAEICLLDCWSCPSLGKLT